MDYKYIQKIDNKSQTASLMIKGIIGEAVNGDDISNEMDVLMQLGINDVTLRINSGGGSIVNGFSVVSANLAFAGQGGIVRTVNEGVADSMATFILASGTKGYRSALAFATSFFHKPILDGVPMDDIEDKKIKKEMQTMLNSLVTILVGATSMSRKEANQLMSSETRLTAKELKQKGIIDKIIKVNNQPILNNSMTVVQRIAACSEIDYKILNKSNMVNKLLNLADEASETAQKEAIVALQTEAAKVSNLTEEITALKAENKTLKDKEVENTKSVAESLVDAAIESGKFEEAKRSELIDTAIKDVKAFKSLVDAFKVPHFDVTKDLENKDGKVYSEEEIAKIYNEKPELYTKLVNQGKIK